MLLSDIQLHNEQGLRAVEIMSDAFTIHGDVSMRVAREQGAVSQLQLYMRQLTSNSHLCSCHHSIIIDSAAD